MTILDTLAETARKRCLQDQQLISLEEMIRAAQSLPKKDFAFEKALKNPGLSVIAECKKASPSRGLIAPDFPVADIAQAYEEAGADAISVLTEPSRFLGSDEFLKQVCSRVTIPVLRKDFIIDPYMIYQARVLGADAVLLICSILSQEELTEFHQTAQDLGLSALVEAHDAGEVAMALKAGARMIGINNRNLKDFSVNMDQAGSLSNLIPDDVIFVSESGMLHPEDLLAAQKAGADAVLIGESLMRSENKTEKLAELKSLLSQKSCPVRRIS